MNLSHLMYKITTFLAIYSLIKIFKKSSNKKKSKLAYRTKHKMNSKVRGKKNKLRGLSTLEEKINKIKKKKKF